MALKDVRVVKFMSVMKLRNEDVWIERDTRIAGNSHSFTKYSFSALTLLVG